MSRITAPIPSSPACAGPNPPSYSRFACVSRRALCLPVAACLILAGVPAWGQANPNAGNRGGALAAKGALIASIGAENSRTDLTPATKAAVQAFLDDTSNPVRDRLELKIVFEQAKLRRTTDVLGRTDRLQAHAAHAADLIREFPGEPEGYGYLLSVAKAETPAKARAAAEMLLASAAPPAVKLGAQRVLAQQALIGTRLELPGAEAAAALAATRGRPLVIYAWTAADAGIGENVRRLARTTGFAFLGINLDADTAAARTAAASRNLPGTQLYDGGGLDGSVARRLEFTMAVALYLVDADGIIRDVGAHRETTAAVKLLIGKGRP